MSEPSGVKVLDETEEGSSASASNDGNLSSADTASLRGLEGHGPEKTKMTRRKYLTGSGVNKSILKSDGEKEVREREVLEGKLGSYGVNVSDERVVMRYTRRVNHERETERMAWWWRTYYYF